jgi:hypothetical protein
MTIESGFKGSDSYLVIILKNGRTAGRLSEPHRMIIEHKRRDIEK